MRGSHAIDTLPVLTPVRSEVHTRCSTSLVLESHHHTLHADGFAAGYQFLTAKLAFAFRALLGLEMARVVAMTQHFAGCSHFEPVADASA